MTHVQTEKRSYTIELVDHGDAAESSRYYIERFPSGQIAYAIDLGTGEALGFDQRWQLRYLDANDQLKSVTDTVDVTYVG